MKRATTLAIAAAVGALVLTGCGSSGTASGFKAPDVPMAKKLGANEGAVNILAWPGYAENGTNNPKINWVAPFEKATGCHATVKYFGTSDEAVNLIKTGDYDVVSASGDATLRLIAAGDVAPVNTSLLKNYGDIRGFLKNQPYNSVNGQMYGMPQGWGANLLTYNPNVVKPAPTSWSSVFSPTSPYAGKITPYDSPIYIADAALYLMNTQPSLGIKDPYALDARQLAAAVAILKTQRHQVSEYWSDYLKQQQAFEGGDSVIGTSWQFIVNLIAADKKPIKAFVPAEGSTGWSDTWMIATKSKHPNCAYAWLDYIGGPAGNAASAYYFGEAPANAKACDVIATTDKDPAFCATFHAGDVAYAKKLWYWTTPVSTCLDGRTNVKCTTYADWTQAWTDIKG